MKTNSSSVSRRSVLSGSLAALDAKPTAAATAMPRGDAALLSMVQEWLQGRDQLDQLEAAYAVAEERYSDMRPDSLRHAFVNLATSPWGYALRIELASSMRG